MTAYLKYVILGLILIVVVAVIGIVVLAVVGRDVPDVLGTIVASGLTGLVGLLVPAEVKAPQLRAAAHKSTD